MNKFSDIYAVMNMVGLSRSTLYGMIQRGEFPPQVYISPRRVVWVTEEVEKWLDERIEARFRPSEQDQNSGEDEDA